MQVFDGADFLGYAKEMSSGEASKRVFSPTISCAGVFLPISLFFEDPFHFLLDYREVGP